MHVVCPCSYVPFCVGFCELKVMLLWQRTTFGTFSEHGGVQEQELGTMQQNSCAEDVGGEAWNVVADDEDFNPWAEDYYLLECPTGRSGRGRGGGRGRDSRKVNTCRQRCARRRCVGERSTQGRGRGAESL